MATVVSFPGIFIYVFCYTFCIEKQLQCLQNPASWFNNDLSHGEALWARLPTNTVFLLFTTYIIPESLLQMQQWQVNHCLKCLGKYIFLKNNNFRMLYFGIWQTTIPMIITDLRQLNFGQRKYKEKKRFTCSHKCTFSSR